MMNDYADGGGDNERRRKALLEQMQGSQQDTGGLTTADLTISDQVPGGTVAPAEAPAPLADGPAAPNYKTLGAFGGKLKGYDMAKFNRPYDDWSEKYKIGAVQSHFDPLKGVTPEFLAALKAQGIGGADFSGEGDQLNVINQGGYDRFGKGGSADVITGLKGQNQDTAWNPWLIDEQAGAGGGQAQPGPMMNAGALGGGELDSQLSGDPLAQIKAALARMSGQRPNMQALLAQLGGGNG